MKKGSRLLVIDASVAQRAGGSAFPSPEAARCRDFLSRVLSLCHRISYTPKIRDEWQRHLRPFAATWLQVMTQRRKRIGRDEPDSELLGAALESFLDAAPEQAAAHRLMLKDAHLLAASLAADRVVVSLDERARKAFSRLALGTKRLRAIRWVNPELDDDRWSEPPSTWGQPLGEKSE